MTVLKVIKKMAFLTLLKDFIVLQQCEKIAWKAL